VCQKAESSGKKASKHECFKNWDGSSTSMESDIIVDGFNESLSMHNVIYDKLIGDGDSSVMKKLTLSKPYGPDFYVKKIECINHIPAEELLQSYHRYFYSSKVFIWNCCSLFFAKNIER